LLSHEGKLLSILAICHVPTTPASLATLLDLPSHDVATHVQAFVDQRLLTTETPLDPVTDSTILHICHRSLCDFVVDPQRCHVQPYLLSQAYCHEKLLNRCLWLLNGQLRRDICDIQNPALANTEIPDFTRIARSVPRVISYACLFWPVHLVGSTDLSAIMSKSLLEFCQEHLLHWLEVLSLLGELSLAGKHLPEVIAWCQVSPSNLLMRYCLIHINRITLRNYLRCKRSSRS
jgi:hypothetical protein